MTNKPSKDSRWAVSGGGQLSVVHPIDDIRPHDLTYDLVDGDLSLHCWCRPDYDHGVIVHHSADRRELKE